jgi:hypothetical protein
MYEDNTKNDLTIREADSSEEFSLVGNNAA